MNSLEVEDIKKEEETKTSCQTDDEEKVKEQIIISYYLGGRL